MNDHCCHYVGRCHCGAIGFDYKTAVAPCDWAVRACQCRFCRAHGALSTSDPGGELNFIGPKSGHLRRYRFATRSADFLFCGNCGAYIGAVIGSGAGHYGIVNVRALATVPGDLGDAIPVSYDSERKQARISRRESRWTPVAAMPGH